MKTILLAEDDAFTREVYRQGLVREGFQVETAADGVIAATALCRCKPDLIVLDLMMPKLSGVEVLKFIRSHPQLKTTPVVIFTSTGLADMVEPAMRLGVQRAVSKTEYTPARLAALALELLSGSSDGSPAHTPKPTPNPPP